MFAIRERYQYRQEGGRLIMEPEPPMPGMRIQFIEWSTHEICGYVTWVDGALPPARVPPQLDG